MTPRPSVVTVQADEPVSRAVQLMATGPSRLPVLGADLDEVRGLICLRDVLALDGQDLATLRIDAVARRPVLVPASLPLTTVLGQLRARDEELACVVDEYGGLAGVVTAEDLAEELVGEITDEHDPPGAEQARAAEGGGWLVDAAMHLDEAERLLGLPLPRAGQQTVSGLVITELGRLPEVGDTVAVDLPPAPGAEHTGHLLTAEVCRVGRHVPSSVRLRLRPTEQPERARQEADR
jgi:CBS domain containing-hemolysin-like protein